MSDAIGVVRKLFETLEREGTIESILEFMHPEVEWLDTVVTGSKLHGHDGFIEAMTNLEGEGYEGEARPEGFDELDEHSVIARGVTRLSTATSYTDLPAFWAFEVRDGKIARGATATRRDEALAAIGRA